MDVRWRAAVVVLALASPAVSRADAFELVWDKDLAFDYDREHYDREIRQLLDQSYAMVSAELGLSLERPVKVNVLTPARYEAQFGAAAAFRQGARYGQGAIHVNGGSRFTSAFQGLLVHEMTHAVLDHRGTAAGLPLWVNEGLAERLGWKRQGIEDLTFGQKMTLQAEAREHRLTPLPAWGRVTFSYLQCQAAALFFERTAGREKMLAVVRRTLQGEPFEHALDGELRWTIDDLNRKFVEWVEHL